MFAREQHTATLLDNGQILVAGGFNGSEIRTAELYDPAIGTWTETGSLTDTHAGPTATLLTSGEVLLVGGFVSAEIYDAASGTWSTTGSPAFPRSFQTATLLPDGNVLIAGGDIYSTSAELYDPSIGFWLAAGNLITGRVEHTATLLNNGKVLVAGGTDSDLNNLFATAELYDEQAVAPPTTRLANISTRGAVESGDNVMIGGFIVSGSQPKKVIIRALGPSLLKGNPPLPGALTDPSLELHDGTGALLAMNDNWMDAPNVQEIIGSTIPPTDPAESAILMTLPANDAGYTAIVRGVNNTTGIALVEAYDLDQNDSKLANISTRGMVQPDPNALIGGFIVTGTGTQPVIVRALGPSLAQAYPPVPNPLMDPILELHDSNGALLAMNDNWGDNYAEDQQFLVDNGLNPTNNLESAIVVLLSAGSTTGFTAIVRGVNGTSGNALVEVYGLPRAP